LFKLPNPEVKQYARFNVSGAITKGREIRELLESGEYIGWDDPRLVTLRALKRRGIVKDAYYELAKVVGMSKTSSILDFSIIASINRKLLDEQASRFYFIADHVKVKIEKTPKFEVELDLHPHHRKGGRKFQISGSFYLSKKDLDTIEDGETVRLINCMNITKKGEKYIFHSKEAMKKVKKIHWLPVDQVTEVEILMPDCTTLKGYAETHINQLKKGDVIQFERFAFCRLDEKLKFWYTHT
jgi:glutamyl-tRNA synthetase